MKSTFNATILAKYLRQPAARQRTPRRAKAPQHAPALPPGLHLRNPLTVPMDETPAQARAAEQEAIERNARRKHHNTICYDNAGNAYQSLSEARIVLDFQERWHNGFISEPKRGRYAFAHNGIHIGTYTSDLEFDCLAEFSYTTAGGTVRFEAGRRYVCDVKSPVTVTKEFKRTRLLMQAFHNINITEIYTGAPRAKKSKSPASTTTCRTGRQRKSK